MKHTLRYLQGTQDHKFTPHPKTTLGSNKEVNNEARKSNNSSRVQEEEHKEHYTSETFWRKQYPTNRLQTHIHTDYTSAKSIATGIGQMYRNTIQQQIHIDIPPAHKNQHARQPCRHTDNICHSRRLQQSSLQCWAFELKQQLPFSPTAVSQASFTSMLTSTCTEAPATARCVYNTYILADAMVSQSLV